MPRAPQPANPETGNYIQIRLPGWLKNDIIAHCDKLGCSLNAWLLEAVQAALRADRGLPEPPPARAPLPTTADQIRVWATGERLLLPCGKFGSCDGFAGDTWEHDGMGFCLSCGIRVV